MSLDDWIQVEIGRYRDNSYLTRNSSSKNACSTQTEACMRDLTQSYLRTGSIATNRSGRPRARARRRVLSRRRPSRRIVGRLTPPAPQPDVTGDRFFDGRCGRRHRRLEEWWRQPAHTRRFTLGLAGRAANVAATRAEGEGQERRAAVRGAREVCHAMQSYAAKCALPLLLHARAG